MTDRNLRVYDDVLSTEVFSRLKRTIASMPNPPHSYWVDARKPPENLIELVIDCLHRTVLPGRTFVGAEWWFRRESTAVSKKLHFDKDEALAHKGQYVHPNLGSDFYLTDVGGHTLVTDQTCSPDGRTMSPPEPTERRIVAPRENRYMVFDGRLLHAVLPARTDAHTERTTLLVNWWDRPLSNAERLAVTTQQLGLALESAPVSAGACRLSQSASQVCKAAPVQQMRSL